MGTMKTSVTLPEAQMAEIDRIAERLGLLNRAEAIRYLLTFAIESKQVSGAHIDMGDAMGFMKDLVKAAEALPWGVNEVSGLVTPTQGDKNVRSPLPQGKNARGGKRV